jgi:hypothetical protein
MRLNSGVTVLAMPATDSNRRIHVHKTDPYLVSGGHGRVDAGDVAID